MPEPTSGPRAADSAREGGVADRYRSLFVIGRGGMGSVECALERGKDGRIVALKRLLPEGARNPRHKGMFLREARLAALLTHDNVVHAFAFGELYGELFLAMEYVEGETLSRLLSAGAPLDPAMVAYVLACACDGLHAAHELRDAAGNALNVVHRDVSPHNVMVAYDGRVKLLDFGVAKLEAGGTQTRTGEVKGKMAYMSPEQALGDKLDRRSDLWSVGAVLFECMAGKRMWGAGTDLEVMRKLALDAAPRLDEAVPDAPRALVDLYARLVAREAAKRPATAREVAHELRAFASSREVTEADAVRALMQRLFASDAQRKREVLSAALEQAAPAEVESLRHGLESGAVLGRSTLTEPIVMPAPPRARSTGRIALVGVAVAIAVAAAAAFAMKKRTGEAMPDRTAMTAASSSALATPTPTSTFASSVRPPSIAPPRPRPSAAGKLPEVAPF